MKNKYLEMIIWNNKIIFSFNCTAGEVGQQDYCTVGKVGAIVTTGGRGPPFSFEKRRKLKSFKIINLLYYIK